MLEPDGAVIRAGLVTAVAAFTLMNRGPDYKVLYTNVSDRDGGAMAVTLMSSDMGKLYAALAQVVARRGAKRRNRRLRSATAAATRWTRPTCRRPSAR